VTAQENSGPYLDLKIHDPGSYKNTTAFRFGQTARKTFSLFAKFAAQSCWLLRSLRYD
jgi:hypothetical protein